MDRNEVLFFPNRENEKLLADIISQAKKELRICIYTFTNPKLGETIYNLAKNKQVKIRIITDDVQIRTPFNIIMPLVEASEGRIQITTDKSPQAQMHHKYVIIDDRILITGSFNWTKAAVHKNNENVVIMYEQHIIQSFIKNFENLWDDFVYNEITRSRLAPDAVLKGKNIQVQYNCQLEIQQKKADKTNTILTKIGNMKNIKLTDARKKKKKVVKNSDKYDLDEAQSSGEESEGEELKKNLKKLGVTKKIKKEKNEYQKESLTKKIAKFTFATAATVFYAGATFYTYQFSKDSMDNIKI